MKFCKVTDGKFTDFTSIRPPRKIGGDGEYKDNFFEVIEPDIAENDTDNVFEGWELEFKGTYVQAKPKYQARPEKEKKRLKREKRLKEEPIFVATVGSTDYYVVPTTENITMLLGIIGGANKDSEKANFVLLIGEENEEKEMTFTERMLRINRVHAKIVLREITIARSQAMEDESEGDF